MTSGTADEAADRALQSVNRKLDRTLSVEYTVNELIAEATDMTNLGLMYIGACVAATTRSIVLIAVLCGRMGPALLIVCITLVFFG